MRSDRLCRTARQLVEQGIRDGEFPVGGYLPAAATLAARAGCATVTMRQVLRELARDAIVQPAKRWGTRVRRRPPAGRVCLLLSSDEHVNLLLQRPVCLALMEAEFDVDLVPPYLESAPLCQQVRRLSSGTQPPEILVGLTPEHLPAAAQGPFVEFADRFRHRLYFCIDSGIALPPGTRLHMDQLEAARLVVAHLLALGHRTVAVAAGRAADAACPPGVTARYAGALLAAAGAAMVPFMLGQGPEELLRLVRRKQVTAYWGLNDFEVLLIQQYCRGAGLRLPQELALVGRHDTPHSWGGLSSVSLNPAAVAQAVVDELRGLAGGTGTGRDVAIPPLLVPRGSSVPAAAPFRKQAAGCRSH